MIEGCGTHFRSVAVVKRVLDHQPLEHLDGDLTYLPELLKSSANLPQQQPHQEVVSTEVISQRVVQLKICSRHSNYTFQAAEENRMWRSSRVQTALHLDESDVKCVSFTLKPLNPAFPKGHGQVKGDIVLMVANNPQELKLELIQSLVGKQENIHLRL